MRLFIGINLPKDVKDELFSIQNQISANLAKIKWISKHNLHLTLKFLGEVKEDYILNIKNRLEKIAFKPINARLSKLGVFPEFENIKIIWIGMLPEREIIFLQQKVDAELLDLFRFDQRFFPHLTLGRVKLVKRKKEFLSKLRQISVNHKSFEINRFSLIKSMLTKNGPIYEELETFKTKENV